MLGNSPGALHVVRRLVAEQGVLHWRKYALAFGFMGMTAAATAVSTYLFGKVINKAYVDQDWSAIVWTTTSIAALLCIRAAGTYFSTVILSRISNAIVAYNQKRLFDRLMEQNVSYLSSQHSSEFLQRLTGGAVAITQVLNLCVTAIGRDLIGLVGLVAVMIWQDPILSVIVIFVAPGALLTIRKLTKRVRDVAHSQFVTTGRVLQTMQECLQGIRTVKAFNLEAMMRRRMYESVDHVEGMANKVSRLLNRTTPLMELLGALAICACLLYGSYRVIATGAQPGQFFSFLTAFLLAYEPAKRLARLNVELNGALIGAQMLLDILDRPPTEPDEQGLKPDLRVHSGRVQLRDVSFSYRSKEPVLDRIDFVAEPGTTTALVGPSGGGKSTVFALLLRLYDGFSGRITIDDQDILSVTRTSVRSQVMFVSQDIFLFHGTIRANIGFGKPGATEDEIVAAAKAAFAHDFIMKFPNGYDSPVGEHGTQLSGGQRQRIAIARAFLKRAPLVLLDEATASLDSESEELIQKAIAVLCKGRTTIVIAHRLHTIAHADQILVIEGGKIVETGTHERLMRASGRYSSMFSLQHREIVTK